MRQNRRYCRIALRKTNGRPVATYNNTAQNTLDPMSPSHLTRHGKATLPATQLPGTDVGTGPTTAPCSSNWPVLAFRNSAWLRKTKGQPTATSRQNQTGSPLTLGWILILLASDHAGGCKTRPPIKCPCLNSRPSKGIEPDWKTCDHGVASTSIIWTPNPDDRAHLQSCSGC